MSQSKYVIPVLVVTYNGMKWIDRCLRSLLDSDAKAEVYVVDNASTDGTADFIEEQYSEVHLIRLGNNVGFARANNIGLRKITERRDDVGYPGVMLLNQDAYVMRDTLGSLATAVDANPGYGVISPVHLNGTASALDTQFMVYCRESGLDVSTLFENEVAPPDPQTAILDIGFVNAAAWFISRDCLRDVGVLSPKFFMYGEDHEYLNRVTYGGYKVGIHSGTTILHDREHRSARPEAEAEVHYFERKSLITLLHPSYGALRKSYIIFDELFKTFAVRLLRNPVLSIRLLFRKLVILMRVIKCAKTPDAD